MSYTDNNRSKIDRSLLRALRYWTLNEIHEQSRKNKIGASEFVYDIVAAEVSYNGLVVININFAENAYISSSAAASGGVEIKTSNLHGFWVFAINPY